MYTVKFHLKTITPVFMYGADGVSPEMRSQSFKGLLRYWWRALNNSMTLAQLKKKETEIFGGSGDNGKRSEVSIIVQNNDNVKIGANVKTDNGLIWTFNGGQRRLSGKNSGIGYLWYSMVMPNREKRYIKENNNIVLKFSSRNKQSMEQAIAAIWTLINIGSVGSRSRRGAGSIGFVSVDDQHGLISESKLEFVNSNNNFPDFVYKNINIAKQIVNTTSSAKKNIENYSTLDLAKYIISNNSFSSWIEALSEIGEIFEHYRFEKRSDIFDTPAFGFPILHAHDMGSVKAVRHGDKIDRRSSPLQIKIIKQGGNFLWVVFYLAGEFLPRGTQITTKNNNRREPNLQLLNEFWGLLKENRTENIIN